VTGASPISREHADWALITALIIADGSEDARRAIKTAIVLSTKLEPELHIIYAGPDLIHTKVVVQKQHL
jgi:hypothetical protein